MRRGAAPQGLGATLAGIAPYAALNFAAYDVIKRWYYDSQFAPAGGGRQSSGANLVLGGVAGTLAATVCYPLDTIRRRMQLKGRTYSGMGDALGKIYATEGVRGFFNGWTANTLKVAPMSAIRFVTYEWFKVMLGVQRARSDT